MNIHMDIVQIIMILLLGSVLLLLLVMRQLKKLTPENMIAAVIFMGCIMRIGYTIYTPCTLRTYDLLDLNATAYGKAGYLLRLIEIGKLPDSNIVQLYQQPLFYILGAMCAKILQLFCENADSYALVDVSRVIPCLASCGILFIGKSLFDRLGISRKNALYGMIIISFTPVFYVMGGRVGEDSLCTFFMLLALLVTLYWDKNPSWKLTVMLGIIYGLGMLTKISMAVPAVFTAVIFFKKIFIEKTDMKKKSLIGRIIVFGIISLPLGLCYSFRNMRLFGQSLTYVLPQEVDGPLYRGNISLVQRFVLPDIGNLLKTPYAVPVDDCNLFSYLLKTELFGEFQYDIWEGIPYILLFLNFCLTIVCLIYGIRSLIYCKKRKPKVSVWWFLLFLSFAAYSYLNYPFGCTMDFRYYAVLAVCKALLLAQILDGEGVGDTDEIRMLQGMIKGGSILFGVFSCVMFCFIKT